MWNIIIALSGAWLVSSVESYQSTEELSVGDMSPPLRIHLTDMERMVDLTNNLGVSILKEHSHSKGNFAFSPYGVASILVVLYEGAKGQSAVQIQRAFGFPWNKDSIRVGFREIHQHLRSYFSHEGYLSGINLNKQQSSLRPEYKKILRIYGYDVDLDDEIVGDLGMRTGAITPGNKTTTAKTTTQSVTEPQSIETTTESQSTTESDETTIPPTTTTEETTSNTSVTTTTEQNLTTPITTTNPPTTTPKEETTTESESTIKVILEEYTTRPTEQTETTDQTTEEITSAPQESDNIMLDMNDRVHISLTIESECRKRGRRSDCPTGDAESKTDKPKTDNPKATLESVNNEIAKLDNKMLIPQADDPLILEESTWSETSNRKSRRTRNIATAVGAKSAIEMSGISKRQAANIRRILNRRVHLWTSSSPRRRAIRRPRRTPDYLKQPENGELSLQVQNGMYDPHIPRYEEVSKDLPRKLFLLDESIDTPVPMMSYTYIFPYAYLPKLRAKALEFPLDDSRYKLLILLPIDRSGLRDLIQDLMGYPLRLVLDSMKPAKVNATIPTFMVEGFVILTTTLKKLGIRDVFDPRKANLSGMSVDPELYVRNVEQSVTVVIRNYVELLDSPTSTMAARYSSYNFEVTHPFLYFVLDTATNVALMTGQMLDPLNTRIY